MARKSSSIAKTFPSRESASAPEALPKSAETADLLGRVAAILREGDAAHALTLITKSRNASAWVTNAQGVCELRLGNSETAVSLFRGLVLTSGIFLRPDAPTVFKTNYATALFAAGNLAGGLNALEELRTESHPAVQRLLTAVQRWKNSLNWWQRFNWFLGGPPNRPVELEPPVGDLE